MTKVMITFKDEDQHFIEVAMKTGRYVTESEAVADALSELRAREKQPQARLAELRAKIMIGIEELDRGDGAEWNVEEVKAEGRALLARP
jgi:putative addiction module CopG family antidote